jgi:predicted O-methyltransferase YrrM
VVDAYKDFDSVLVGDFQGGPFDFAFIDATGEYADTIRIMERVTDHLVADNALMAVHDYGTMPWPGVGEAVRDYCTQRNLNFGIVDTLAIVRVGHPDD